MALAQGSAVYDPRVAQSMTNKQAHSFNAIPKHVFSEAISTECLASVFRFARFSCLLWISGGSNEAGKGKWQDCAVGT